MRFFAVLCVAAVLGVACSFPVLVQPVPARDVPLPAAPLAASLGLFVDAARVPDEVVVHDSYDSPMCGFIRYPLTARDAVTKSVVETIGLAVRDVRLLDTPIHPWNLRQKGLDAALIVRVEAFAVHLSPMTNVVGAEFEVDAELTLSAVAITGNGREIRKSLGATAAQKAVDRWGFGGCGSGALPATQAAARAIRDAMAQLAEWLTCVPEVRLPDHTLHSPVVAPAHCQPPGETP